MSGCRGSDRYVSHVVYGRVQNFPTVKTRFLVLTFESLHDALFSLDIEGFEWEFLKLRTIRADLVVVLLAQMGCPPNRDLGRVYPSHGTVELLSVCSPRTNGGTWELVAGHDYRRSF